MLTPHNAEHSTNHRPWSCEALAQMIGCDSGRGTVLKTADAQAVTRTLPRRGSLPKRQQVRHGGRSSVSDRKEAGRGTKRKRGETERHTHIFTHTHTYTHTLTHSLTHSLTHTLTHSHTLAHSLTHSPLCALAALSIVAVCRLFATTPADYPQPAPNFLKSPSDHSPPLSLCERSLHTYARFSLALASPLSLFLFLLSLSLLTKQRRAKMLPMYEEEKVHGRRSWFCNCSCSIR